MIGSTIQRELGSIILHELTDPRLPRIISVTRVKVSPDIEHAEVFVTVMGTPGQQTMALNALKHSASLMRGKLTKAMTLRVAPYLHFQLDEGLKKELEVLDLLEMVRRENEEIDRKRAAEAGAAGGAVSEVPSADDAPSGGESGPSRITEVTDSEASVPGESARQTH